LLSIVLDVAISGADEAMGLNAAETGNGARVGPFVAGVAAADGAMAVEAMVRLKD
jgi:hypothetical protein